MRESDFNLDRLATAAERKWHERRADRLRIGAWLWGTNNDMRPSNGERRHDTQRVTVQLWGRRLPLDGVSLMPAARGVALRLGYSHRWPRTVSQKANHARHGLGSSAMMGETVDGVSDPVPDQTVAVTQRHVLRCIDSN
jgi:hypothetical protein